jgi:hypothetical protein
MLQLAHFIFHQSTDKSRPNYASFKHSVCFLENSHFQSKLRLLAIYFVCSDLVKCACVPVCSRAFSVFRLILLEPIIVAEICECLVHI